MIEIGAGPNLISAGSFVLSLARPVQLAGGGHCRLPRWPMGPTSRHPSRHDLLDRSVGDSGRLHRRPSRPCDRQLVRLRRRPRPDPRHLERWRRRLGRHPRRVHRRDALRALEGPPGWHHRRPDGSGDADRPDYRTGRGHRQRGALRQDRRLLPQLRLDSSRDGRQKLQQRGRYVGAAGHRLRE